MAELLETLFKQGLLQFIYSRQFIYSHQSFALFTLPPPPPQKKKKKNVGLLKASIYPFVLRVGILTMEIEVRLDLAKASDLLSHWVSLMQCREP